MKRHKYTCNIILKKYPQNPNMELKNIAIKHLIYNYKHLNNSAKFSLKLFAKRLTLQPSKINTYCLVTGRMRFTVKKTQTSRHIFFENSSNGYNTGFFKS